MRRNGSLSGLLEASRLNLKAQTEDRSHSLVELHSTCTFVLSHAARQARPGRSTGQARIWVIAYTPLSPSLAWPGVI